MDLIGTKVLVLFLLGLLKMVSGLLPVFLKRLLRGARWLETFMSCVLCIGGGVLLATVFIHMIPEVRESISHAIELGSIPDTHYPLAELIICFGFFIIYMIESLVHRIFGLAGHAHGAPGGRASHALQPPAKTNDKYRVSVNSTGTDNPSFEDVEKSEAAKDDTDNAPASMPHPDAMPWTKTPFGSKYRCSVASPNQTPAKNVYNVSSATLTSYTSHSQVSQFGCGNWK